MPKAITAHDLSLRRGGKDVIDGLNFTLNDQGLTAVMGPNGAGKSLTLRMIAGLITPDRGQIDFHGPRPQARDLAVVFQTPVLLRRSVRGNLAHALQLLGFRGAKLTDRVTEFLHMGGLDGLADRPARQLSGGEKQRLALVRALAGSPRFLLLDEPTASLDPSSTAAIEQLIQTTRSQGTRILLVTHDQHQAQRLADDVLFINKGRLAEAGPAEAFFKTPKSRVVRGYLNGELLT